MTLVPTQRSRSHSTLESVTKEKIELMTASRCCCSEPGMGRGERAVGRMRSFELVSERFRACW
eukprot:5262382-Prymnesium_polylepis.1